MAVVTPELSGRASGGRSPTQVVQLVGFVPTVIVTIADEVSRHAASVLAGELVLLTGLVGAALLVAAIPTVIPPVTPEHATHSAVTITCFALPCFKYFSP